MAMRLLLALALVLVLGQNGAVVAQSPGALFTISIDIGGEAPEELAVRDGDVPSRLAEDFAKRHGLNDRAANTIAQAILKKAEELTSDEKPAATPSGGVGTRNSEKPVLFSLSINIGGTAVPLDVRHGDVPKNVAASFAEEYKLDVSAQEKITQAIINKATEIQQAGAGASTPPAAVSQSTTAGPSAATVAAKAAAADAATARGSPSAAAAAAPDSGSVDGTQRLLFSLDVNLGGAQGKVPLNVHAGAVPAELAQQFATQYGLGSTAVSQLTEAIVSEAKQQGFG